VINSHVNSIDEAVDKAVEKAAAVALTAGMDLAVSNATRAVKKVLRAASSRTTDISNRVNDLLADDFSQCSPTSPKSVGSPGKQVLAYFGKHRRPSFGNGSRPSSPSSHAPARAHKSEDKAVALASQCPQAVQLDQPSSSRLVARRTPRELFHRGETPRMQQTFSLSSRTPRMTTPRELLNWTPQTLIAQPLKDSSHSPMRTPRGYTPRHIEKDSVRNLMRVPEL